MSNLNADLEFRIGIHFAKDQRHQKEKHRTMVKKNAIKKLYHYCTIEMKALNELQAATAKKKAANNFDDRKNGQSDKKNCKDKKLNRLQLT